MLRLILYILSGYILFKLIAQTYKNYKQSQLKKKAAKQTAGETKVVGGEMVKDPMCNTYIPKNKSIKDTINGNTYYFCSQRCREQFIKQQKAKNKSLDNS